LQKTVHLLLSNSARRAELIANGARVLAAQEGASRRNASLIRQLIRQTKIAVPAVAGTAKEEKEERAM
jgi:hypothetical protein